MQWEDLRHPHEDLRHLPSRSGHSDGTFRIFFPHLKTSRKLGRGCATGAVQVKQDAQFLLLAQTGNVFAVPSGGGIVYGHVKSSIVSPGAGSGNKFFVHFGIIQAANGP